MYKLNDKHINSEEAVTVYYYALLDMDDFVIIVQSFPVEVNAANLIPLDFLDEGLIGKWYNRETGRFETKRFYYVVLDGKDIVIDVITLPEEATADNLISIPAPDESLIGLWYNRVTGEFKIPPIHVLAEINTGEINTINPDGTPKDEWLSSKLNEIDGEISNLKEAVSTAQLIADTAQATASEAKAFAQSAQA